MGPGEAVSIVTVSLALFVGAIALVLLLEVVANRPVLVAGLILGLQIMDIAVDAEYIPSLDLGGTSIYLADVLFGIVALSAITRLFGTKKLVGAQFAVLIAGLLTAFSVFRGVTEAGLGPAVNEARPSFYFFSGVSYFMTIGGQERVIERISRLFLIAAGALSLLIVILWATTLTGGSPPTPLATPLESGFRVIGAGRTMILTQAILIALPGVAISRSFHPMGRLRYLAFGLLPVAVLLQHRTVWVGTAAGLLFLAIRGKSSGRSAIIGLVGVSALSVLAMALLMTGDSNPLTESLRRSSTDTHTLEWRYEGWVELLEGRDAPQGTAVLIGTPYGSGYDRIIEGRQVDVNPHNYYVETYLRQGFIGLGALIIAYGFAISILRKQPARVRSVGLANTDALLALAVTQLLFFFTYRPSPDLGAVAGIIIGAAAAIKLTASGTPRRVKSPEPRLQPERTMDRVRLGMMGS